MAARDNGGMWLYVVVQAVVTVALLGFGWLMRDTDRTIASVVVTAAVAYWLGEAPRVGRQVLVERRNGIAAQRGGGGDA